MTAPCPQRPRTSPPLGAIVLAGCRPQGDRLAQAHGVTTKAEIETLGQSMISRVVDALVQSGRVSQIVLVGRRQNHSHDNMLMRQLDRVDHDWHDPSRTISAGLLDVFARYGARFNWLVTTADHPLLTGPLIKNFLMRAEDQAGVSVGLVNRSVIEHAYPGLQRTYLKFRSQSVSGANLFLIDPVCGRRALQAWSDFEANRKAPWRMALTLGPVTVLCLLMGVLKIGAAFRRLSKLAGCEVHPVSLPYAEAAIDVDKQADLLAVDAILARRFFGTGSTDPSPAQRNTGDLVRHSDRSINAF